MVENRSFFSIRIENLSFLLALFNVRLLHFSCNCGEALLRCIFFRNHHFPLFAIQHRIWDLSVNNSEKKLLAIDKKNISGEHLWSFTFLHESRFSCASAIFLLTPCCSIFCIFCDRKTFFFLSHPFLNSKKTHLSVLYSNSPTSYHPRARMAVKVVGVRLVAWAWRTRNESKSLSILSQPSTDLFSSLNPSSRWKRKTFLKSPRQLKKHSHYSHLISHRSTKSEKMYPSMLSRGPDIETEPYYCLPVNGNGGGTVTWSQPTSPTPRGLGGLLSPTHNGHRLIYQKKNDEGNIQHDIFRAQIMAI